MEEQLFAAVRTILPEAAKPIYDAQLASIVHAHRPFAWSEICYYPKKRWWKRRVDWSGMPKFTCKDEFQLTEVRFAVRKKRFKATLNCLAGHIFDFRIHPGGKSIAFSPWDGTPRVVLLNDPLRASSFKKREKLPSAWREFLDTLQGKSPENWRLFDEKSAYRIAEEDGDYLLLAESEWGEFLMVRLDPPSEGFFHVEGYDSKPKPLSDRLESVISNGRD